MELFLLQQQLQASTTQSSLRLTTLIGNLAEQELELEDERFQIKALQNTLLAKEQEISGLRASIAGLEALVTAKDPDGLEQLSALSEQRLRRKEVGEALAALVRAHELEESKKRHVFALAEATLKALMYSSSSYPSEPFGSSSTSPLSAPQHSEADLQSEYLRQRCISYCRTVAEYPLAHLQASRDILQVAPSASVERVTSSKKEVFLKPLAHSDQAGFGPRKSSGNLHLAVDFILSLLRALENLALIERFHGLPLASGEEEQTLSTLLVDSIGDSIPFSRILKACTWSMIEGMTSIWQKYLADHHIPVGQVPGSWRVDIRFETQRICITHHGISAMTTDIDFEYSFEWVVSFSLDPDLFIVTNVECDCVPSPLSPPPSQSHLYALFNQAIIPIVRSPITSFDKETVSKQLRKFLSKLARSRPKTTDRHTIQERHLSMSIKHE